MKLTAKQIQHLKTLSDCGERGAYPGLHMGVLNSLSLKGLVKAKHGLGSMALPHTSIKWSITDTGRLALSLQQGNSHD
jgi:hypothetical protein